jgi:predicted ATPase
MAEETEETGRDVRLLQSITLRNILSFGPDTPKLELRALNVLIGPNGSGKSNLLASVDLLKRTADSLDLGLSAGEDFIWKGAVGRPATLQAVSRPAFGELIVIHRLEIQEVAPITFQLGENISQWTPPGGIPPLFPFFNSIGKTAYLGATPIPADRFNDDASVLSQFRDPLQYPELTDLGESYQQIRIFRDWGIGDFNSPRRPQRTDVRNDFPAADGSNLGLVLNKLRRSSELKKRFLAALNELYADITDFDVAIEGGYAHVYLQEGDFSIPASRLSDGTLRYLYLLAILLHPTPPPLICLEEPELGLHPDAVLAIGRLIKEASQRTQLIITTHSDILVDVLGEQPEDIIVCEKHEGQTQLNRLHEPELRGWLERYSLSQLWTKGKLGGTRW